MTKKYTSLEHTIKNVVFEAAKKKDDNKKNKEANPLVDFDPETQDTVKENTLTNRVIPGLGAVMDYRARREAGQSVARSLGGAAASTLGGIAGGAVGGTAGSFAGPIGTVAGGLAGATYGATVASDKFDDLLDGPKKPDGKPVDPAKRLQALQRAGFRDAKHRSDYEQEHGAGSFDDNTGEYKPAAGAPKPSEYKSSTSTAASSPPATPEPSNSNSSSDDNSSRSSSSSEPTSTAPATSSTSSSQSEPSMNKDISSSKAAKNVSTNTTQSTVTKPPAPRASSQPARAEQPSRTQTDPNARSKAMFQAYSDKGDDATSADFWAAENQRKKELRKEEMENDKPKSIFEAIRQVKEYELQERFLRSAGSRGSRRPVSSANDNPPAAPSSTPSQTNTLTGGAKGPGNPEVDSSGWPKGAQSWAAGPLPPRPSTSGSPSSTPSSAPAASKWGNKTTPAAAPAATPKPAAAPAPKSSVSPTVAGAAVGAAGAAVMGSSKTGEDKPASTGSDSSSTGSSGNNNSPKADAGNEKAEKPAANKSSAPAAAPARQTFSQAFAAARKEAGGAGGKFTYNGREYQTNVRGEKYQAAGKLKTVGSGSSTAAPKAAEAPKPEAPKNDAPASTASSSTSAASSSTSGQSTPRAETPRAETPKTGRDQSFDTGAGSTEVDNDAAIKAVSAAKTATDRDKEDAADGAEIRSRSAPNETEVDGFTPPKQKKGLQVNSYNPLIAGFLQLQETKHSNIFEAAKKLKGNQHKLDVAEPKGELTAADFKKLRQEEVGTGMVKKDGKDYIPNSIAKNPHMQATPDKKEKTDKDRGEMNDLVKKVAKEEAEVLFSDAELDHIEAILGEEAPAKRRGRPPKEGSAAYHRQMGTKPSDETDAEGSIPRVAAQVRTSRTRFNDGGKETIRLQHPVTKKFHEVPTKAANDFNVKYASAEKPAEKDAVEKAFIDKHMS